MRDNQANYSASHTSEQQKTSKICDTLSFTAPRAKNLRDTFPAKEEIAPYLLRKMSSSEVQEENMSPRNFIYPNNITLKNKYGIRNYRQFQTQCAHDSARAIINLRHEAPPQKLTSAYLLYIHQTLFKNTFEWAGQTRDKPFTFEDGTVACMPKMKKAGIFFASGEKVQEGLRNLDRTLSEKNNLQDLTREEFIEHATEMMIQLNYTHPFREGNGRTQRMFFEKLGQIAGHELEFSLVTKERMNLASIASLKFGDSEAMKYLFDDISNPEKTLILKEFMDHMKTIGLESINHRLIMTAKEGETYTGFYRGSGANGFMVDVNGTFIIGNKNNLSPEQLKTLKVGDALSFTAPRAQDLQQTLIPREKIAPLTRDEIAERVQNSALVQTSIRKIEELCKIVYGDPHILQNKMPKIKIPVTTENIAEGEQFARQVESFPQSMHRLHGINICGIKSGARAHAEENILPLSHAIFNYVHAVRLAENNILENHQLKQKRCEKSVKTPSQAMNNLFSLSKEQQQEFLAQSPELRMQINTYMLQLQERLSPCEQRAIRENNYQELAKTIGTSVNNAKEIAKIFQKGKEIQLNMQPEHFLHRQSKEHAAASWNKSTKEYAQISSQSVMNTKQLIKSIKQEKAPQQSIQRHKTENVKVMTMCL
ncbi:hypothetical protein ME9_01576 [Bartonella taylorii 8TBB]|uniref:protein adenylyltransferase n=1 Tax=Bartonella taylorii 8TBB TaxID=1094560 RepID=A0A9P2RYM8_BARTA|nr:BID domain-containing T4SS effector [Bartonella taylorii]EJF92368.1 hypothetical protein ME9_01576 [Bartonella taylorii 8TBB]